MFKALLLGLALSSVLGVSAGAQSDDNVLASDPARIAGLLQDAGYRAQLTNDSDGDPMIKSAAAGSDFTIFFFNCTDGKNCKTIQFFAGFDKAQPMEVDVVNRWNREKRFGKAYLDDEGDPLLEMDLNLDFGGISLNNFRDNLKVWESLLAEFKTAIDW